MSDSEQGISEQEGIEGPDTSDEDKMPELAVPSSRLPPKYEELYLSEGGTRYFNWDKFKLKMQSVLTSILQVSMEDNDKKDSATSHFLQILKDCDCPNKLRIVLYGCYSACGDELFEARRTFCSFLTRPGFPLLSFALISDNMSSVPSIGCYGHPAGKFASLNLQSSTCQIVCTSMKIFTALMMAYKERPLTHLEIIFHDRIDLLNIMMQPVAFALDSQRDLRSLTLANLSLGQNSCIALVKWINRLPDLRELYLQNCHFGFLYQICHFNRNESYFLKKLHTLVIRVTEHYSLSDVMVIGRKLPCLTDMQIQFDVDSLATNRIVKLRSWIEDIDHLFNFELRGCLDYTSDITLAHRNKYCFLTTTDLCDFFPFPVYFLILTFIYPHLSDLRNVTSRSCLTKKNQSRLN
jgi:hypothetical protein